MAMGQNPVPSVNIPFPAKIDQNGWCTFRKMVPLVLTHSHMVQSSNCAAAIQLAVFGRDFLAAPSAPAPTPAPAFALPALIFEDRRAHAGSCVASSMPRIWTKPYPPWFLGLGMSKKVWLGHDLGDAPEYKPEPSVW